MKFVMGIDGGGTKTEFCLATIDGKIAAETVLSGSSYLHRGISQVIKTLKKGINICLNSANADRKDIVMICAGIPYYGENEDGDSRISGNLRKAFGKDIYITNDVELSWAGALAMQPGISVVSGTGSIAYGRDMHGDWARSGGWNEFFSDEGSCYWFGRKTMELFSKQSDGRLPKGPLYELIKTHFNIKNDFEFIQIMLKQYIPHREKVAQLQLLLSRADTLGDDTAAAIYLSGIKELVDLADAIKKKLDFEKAVSLSFSGGLFKGETSRSFFVDEAKKRGYSVSCPILSPAKGALLIAALQCRGIDYDEFKNNLIKQEKE